MTTLHTGPIRSRLFRKGCRLWHPLVAVALTLFCLGVSSLIPGDVRAAPAAPAAPSPGIVNEAGPAKAGAGKTVADIQARHSLRCAVQAAYGGYASLQGDGQWQGFMIDYCRAIAAAVLGSPDQIEILHTESAVRFDVVSSGQVDVLLSGTTATLGRSAGMGFVFPGIYLYDGQGFLAHADSGITSLATAGSARVCVIANTTSIQNLRDFVRRTGASLRLVEATSDEGAWGNFLKRRCDLYTNDRLGLRVRAGSTPNPGTGFTLLPDVISREPLGPMIRNDDPQFAHLLRWLLNGLVAAEDLGITRASVQTPPDPSLPHDALVLYGRADDYGAAFGIQAGWLKRAVAAVGNAGEIYNRNLGVGSPLKIDRGLNDLWTRGGLLYPVPLR